jgi:hypothetical protein
MHVHVRVQVYSYVQVEVHVRERVLCTRAYASVWVYLHVVYEHMQVYAYVLQVHKNGLLYVRAYVYIYRGARERVCS